MLLTGSNLYVSKNSNEGLLPHAQNHSRACAYPPAMERFSVDRLDGVLQAVEGRSEDVYLLFCGGLQPETGQSWCPDCVKGGIRIMCI